MVVRYLNLRSNHGGYLLLLLLLQAVPFSTRARFCSPARVIVRPPCRTEYDDDDNDNDEFLLPILTMLSSGGRGLAPGLLAPAGHAVGSGTHGRQRSTCR